jgi:hypothetical protein
VPPIAKTLIATSLPVDLCRGFALFPDLGVARAGITVNGSITEIFNLAETTIIAFRASFNLSGGLFIGMCGPSYAIALFAEGQYTASQLSLAVTGDDTQAGFLFGFNVSAKFTARAQVINLRWFTDGWNSRIQSEWIDAFDRTFDFKLDVVELVIRLLLNKLAKDNRASVSYNLLKAADVLPLLGSYSIFGQSVDAIGSGRGRITVRPRVNLPINIAPLLKKIPKVGAVIKVLKKAGFTFSFGPLFTLTIPVTIRVVGFGVDDATYQTNLTWDNAGNVVARYTSGNVPAAAQEIDMGLSNAIDSRFGFHLGVFANLKFLKVFNIGATYSIDIGPFLNIVPDFDSHLNTLTSTVGVTNPFQARIPSEEEDVEVAFEPFEENDVEVIFEPLETGA